MKQVIKSILFSIVCSILLVGCGGGGDAVEPKNAPIATAPVEGGNTASSGDESSGSVDSATSEPETNGGADDSRGDPGGNEDDPSDPAGEAAGDETLNQITMQRAKPRAKVIAKDVSRS